MKLNYLIPLALISLLFFSCDKDEPVAPATVITFEAQTFEVLETITDADEIGQVVATSNMTDPITFRIIENSDDLFTITESGGTGLASGRRVSFKTAASHQIIVEATDGEETATATITINVINVPDPFITTWQTNNPGTSSSNQVTITTVDGQSYDFSIDWGDGSQDSNVTGPITHTYAMEGTYTISILGTFPGFNGQVDAQKLLSIEQWGDIEWKTMERAFIFCRNLQLNATDAPDLTQVTNMSSMFGGARSLNADLSNWDVSNVTNMSYMFNGANAFNGDISNWDVSNVTDMSEMFYDTENFNGDISNWDVSNVINMEAMLRETYSFNQDISNWNVSNVTNMNRLFQQAEVFNGDISNWDVSSVTTMSEMFYAAVFNGDISNWDVSSVTDMSSMFRDANFNGNLSNWNVSNVTDMNRMFWDAIFSGDLSNWNISQVTGMNNFIADSGISTVTYDSMLTAWSNLTLQSNVNFGAGNLKYSSTMQSARDVLTNTYNWTITDGGPDF